MSRTAMQKRQGTPGRMQAKGQTGERFYGEALGDWCWWVIKTSGSPNENICHIKCALLGIYHVPDTVLNALCSLFGIILAAL